MLDTHGRRNKRENGSSNSAKHDKLDLVSSLFLTLVADGWLAVGANERTSARGRRGGACWERGRP